MMKIYNRNIKDSMTIASWEISDEGFQIRVRLVTSTGISHMPVFALYVGSQLVYGLSE